MKSCCWQKRGAADDNSEAEEDAEEDADEIFEVNGNRRDERRL